MGMYLVVRLNFPIAHIIPFDRKERERRVGTATVFTSVSRLFLSLSYIHVYCSHKHQFYSRLSSLFRWFDVLLINYCFRRCIKMFVHFVQAIIIPLTARFTEANYAFKLEWNKRWKKQQKYEEIKNNNNINKWLWRIIKWNSLLRLGTEWHVMHYESLLSKFNLNCIRSSSTE